MIKRSHGIRDGVILYALLGIYFVVIDALGWADNTFLRLGNYIFIILMINKTLKSTVRNGESYLNKLAVGVVMVSIAMVLGTLSLFIYLKLLEPDLERYTSSLIAATSYSGLSIAIFIQSLTSSVVLVFVLLQFYKNKKPNEVN